jgi:hypothetical protein
MGWRPAGTILLITLALAGCLSACSAGGLDSGLVASHVETFEDENVEVKSCEEIGEAISNTEYGAHLDEVWRCDVKREGGSGFVESCYVVYNQGESGIERGIHAPPSVEDAPLVVAASPARIAGFSGGS